MLDRCSKQVSKRCHSKKRRFHGNQHSSKKLDHNKKEVPISHKKVKGVRMLSSKKKVEGFRLLDMVILNGFITTLACPDCLECTITVNENFTKKKGLSSFLSIECSNCQFSKGSYSSQTLTNDNEKGMKPFEINYRAVYALRSVGVGYCGFEKLCGFLNLPRPMTQTNYDYISDALGESAKSTADQSMNNAANEFHKKSEEISNVGVSVSGNDVATHPWMELLPLFQWTMVNFSISSQWQDSANLAKEVKRPYPKKILMYVTLYTKKVVQWIMPDLHQWWR